MGSFVELLAAGAIGFFSAVFSAPLQQFLFRPQVRLTFSGGDDCVSDTPETAEVDEYRKVTRLRKAIYLRVRVENTSKRMAKSCLAYLVKVEREDGTGAFRPTIYSDSIQLAWACRGAAKFSETDIPHGVAQYVDILKTHSDQNVVVPQWWVGPYRYESLFSEKGKYRLTVQVSGDGVAPATVGIIFDWKGQWNTFEARQA